MHHHIPFNLSLFEKNEKWIRHCRNKTIVHSVNYRQSFSSIILIIVNHHYSSHYDTSFFDHQYFTTFCSQFDSDFDICSLDPKRIHSIEFYPMSLQKDDTTRICLWIEYWIDSLEMMDMITKDTFLSMMIVVLILINWMQWTYQEASLNGGVDSIQNHNGLGIDIRMREE